MDFAHVFNGYRYHTKYDHIDYLPSNVLQRTGDNVLALVKRIANSDELTNTEVTETELTIYNLIKFLNKILLNQNYRHMSPVEWFILIFSVTHSLHTQNQLVKFCISSYPFYL